MKISKQTILIALILFIFIASGCSKSLLEPDKGSGGISADPEPGSGFFREESLSEDDTSSGPDEQSGPDQNFGATEQGMPDNDSTDSFRAELFLPEKEGKSCMGDCMDVLLPRDEKGPLLIYRSSNRLKDLHFAFDRYDLDARLRAILRENVAYLKSHPVSKIEIHGHCDERGSNNYNISLGERRANSIKSYLISLGVEESRIHTISYGEEKPLCFESNEECWYQNRRANFLIAE